jgi:hypothetical protein
LPLILKGVINNTGLQNRGELMEALDKLSQPDPAQQQATQQSQQLQNGLLQAQTEELMAKAHREHAEAQKAIVEAQVTPQLAQAKLTAALSTNLDDNNESKDFERRARIAELMIKEKDLTLKEQDSIRNERITMMQMDNKKSNDTAFKDALGG